MCVLSSESYLGLIYIRTYTYVYFIANSKYLRRKVSVEKFTKLHKVLRDKLLILCRFLTKFHGVRVDINSTLHSSFFFVEIN